MMKRFAIALLAASTVIAGCGTSSLPSLSTGSVASSQKPAQKTAAAPAPDDPVGRAVHVGVTAARAQKCGYYFDPKQLRSNFLAAEAQRTTSPEALKKIETSYDFSNLRVSRQIALQEGYCDASRTAAIKKDLTRYLAGDFSAPKKKKVQVASGGVFGFLEADAEPEKFNKEAVFDPELRRRGGSY